MKLRRECAALRPELPWPTHGACLVPGALRLYALNFEWRSIQGRDDVEEEPDIARTCRVVGDHIPFYHSCTIFLVGVLSRNSVTEHASQHAVRTSDAKYLRVRIIQAGEPSGSDSV